ncbi:hypothetical protein BLFGPEAP_02399 [Candidatus Methanoperedenaceae archaeon GB50]|nr:hypothetical protein BLFGPEAP_02399 [Candidatus Methanoperedenaceae archaeon GB50]
MERIISNAEIGARIRLFRKQKNLTQMQLAERVGVSFQQIQNMRRGVTGYMLNVYSRLLEQWGIPISYFFTDFREVYAVQEKAPNYELIPKELQEILPLSKEEILVIKNLRVLSRKTKRCIFEILDSLCQKKT